MNGCESPTRGTLRLVLTVFCGLSRDSRLYSFCMSMIDLDGGWWEDPDVEVGVVKWGMCPRYRQ